MQHIQQIDDRTWTAFRNGDMEAYGAIYRKYYPALYNYGKKFQDCPQSIDDCVQEFLTRFWINRHKLDSVHQLHSYLYASFRNHMIRVLRQNRRMKLNLDEGALFELELSADQLMVDKERIYENSISLQSAMLQLTNRQKEAVFFKFYENLSYEEIAMILGISTKAIYKLMARAISELRKVYLSQQSNVVTRMLLFLLGNTYYFY